MTAPPLPDVPCLRVRLVWNVGELGEAGQRLYFKYSGSAPTAANCITLAGDIAGAANGNLTADVSDDWALNEVDVLDIATNSGASGTWTGTHSGALTGQPLGAQMSTRVIFQIARRYRGGKPGCYMPPPDVTRQGTLAAWTGTHITDVAADFAAFIGDVAALSVGAVGTLAHVNLSYYSGFTNHTSTSGRERAVPTYRPTALHDNVTGYAVQKLISSQRRRRTSTTP